MNLGLLVPAFSQTNSLTDGAGDHQVTADPVGPGPREIERGPPGRHEIALTFDADAEANCFDELIEALDKYHGSAQR